MPSSWPRRSSSPVLADPQPRRAFTLGEILVALAIVAVVTAVLVPTIFSQINKADPQQLGSDALATRSAIEQFATDVRRYPLNFTQLVKRPTAGDDGLVGGDLATPELTRWAGPYIQKDEVAALKTGFSASFDPNFKSLALSSSGLTENVANPKYVVLCVALDSLSALSVDKQFDDGNLSTGSFRWTVNTGTADTLKFLAIPIQ